MSAAELLIRAGQPARMQYFLTAFALFLAALGENFAHRLAGPGIEYSPLLWLAVVFAVYGAVKS